MFGNRQKIKWLEERVDNSSKELAKLSSKTRYLEYLVRFPAKYKISDKLFNRYIICEVELIWEKPVFNGFDSGWRYKAFDSKTNSVITMRTDCSGNIIEEKVCKG